MADAVADEIIKEFDRISSDRGTAESTWNEIAERVLPSYANSFNANQIARVEGEKRTDKLFDSTASVALDRFAAIVDSMVTPRNATWHRLLPSDPYLMKRRPVRLWFEEATRVLFKYRYAPKANFASQNQQVYKSVGAFGTGPMFIDRLMSEPGLRYRNIHLGEIFLQENHQGIVDKAHRYFPLTARQAMQRWGDKLPEAIRTAATGTNADKKFWFIHCVKPRDDVAYGRMDAKGKPIAEYYVSKEERALIEEGGYYTFPYAVSRYEQAPGEVYGRGPAMSVLPAIKTLNEQKKTLLKQGHRTVDPVILAHDDGVLDGFDMKPGAFNAGGVSQDGKLLVHTLPVGRVDVGKEMMDDERTVINDAFLVTLFQILVETPTMTATEVLERTREKGILLAPALGRIQSEYLGPLIEREVDLLIAQQLMPPMPPELVEAKGEYTVEYDSPLSLSMRAGEAAGLMRTVQTALEVVNVTQDPSPLDRINFDLALPDIADIQGVPQKWMRSEDEVLAIRAKRDEQAQTKQLTDALPGVAAMTKAAAVADKGQ